MYQRYNMEKSVHEITKPASRTLGAVYMKYELAEAMTFDVIKTSYCLGMFS